MEKYKEQLQAILQQMENDTTDDVELDYLYDDLESLVWRYFIKED